ncbi:hypothetical protein IV203_009601 [Nitzschia inconspicua]|uniref:Uncharacterized protein n=1 Tax=Nitzschia inconspicua TaxID=303405 RepID=A0A9K3KVG4_9STRA|nr:hypothetical protein IV203_009601 [Nitzschia inconspicua]
MMKQILLQTSHVLQHQRHLLQNQRPCDSSSNNDRTILFATLPGNLIRMADFLVSNQTDSTMSYRRNIIQSRTCTMNGSVRIRWMEIRHKCKWRNNYDSTASKQFSRLKMIVDNVVKTVAESSDPNVTTNSVVALIDCEEQFLRDR